MSRKSIEIIKEAAETLEGTVADVVFTNPDSAQRKAKAKFWQRIADNPMIDTSNLTSEIVAKYCGDKRIHSWWCVGGFQDWFSNQQEYMEKLRYAQLLSIDIITEVMESSHASDTSKLVAAKMVGDITLKLAEMESGKKSKGSGVDGMNLAQLKEFIQKSTGKLTAAPLSDRSEVIEDTEQISTTSDEPIQDESPDIQ